ncbi:MAG: cytoplasmic protein [Desulfobacteraceae bacterium]|jgi:hypothetical protein
MPKHNHTFVENYSDLVGFGLDRNTDEKTIIYYLQKFSDDELMHTIVPRMNDAELADIFDRISALMSKYLSEKEYHRYFLKDEHH